MGWDQGQATHVGNLSEQDRVPATMISSGPDQDENFKVVLVEGMELLEKDHALIGVLLIVIDPLIG